MPLFAQRRQRDAHAERQRRRPFSCRLGGMVFWARGNRRIRREGSVKDLQQAGDTIRTVSKPHPPPGRSLGPGMLRLAGALLTALALAGSVIGSLHWLRRSPHFALRTIRISPTNHVPREVLLQRAQLALGENLFRVNLARAERALMAEPWIRRARLRRELPDTVVLEIEEHQARALVALGALYLTNADGVVFKRATPEEARGLPVVTGIGREGYIADRATAQAQIRQALAVLDVFCAPGRPSIGEVHLDLLGGATLYTETGVAIRLRTTDAIGTRLASFDAVWAELNRRGERPAVIFLDNRAHPDQVTVRLEDRAGPRGQASAQQATLWGPGTPPP
ncbi:MAG: FtsQ-type POTRA domain-containing protein [Myxococcales bacterium]|nr:FtsQ-type POTRA domain-containing protein [Myxococcota bacterium]MDW8281701.1 FtsQ-type POTRA domain-containing protein [Myxococcales bacterium]